MASPAFRASSTGGATTGTSFTMTAPTGTVDNDVIICHILVEAGFSSFSGPSGWTLEYGPIDCTDFTAWVYSIRRSGAPSMGVSWSGSKYYEWCLASFSGCVSSGAYVDTKAQLSAAARTTVDPPAVTTTTIETMIVCSVFHWSGYFSNAGPTGYTQFGEGVFLDNKGAYKTLATATTEDPSAFASPGSSANSWCSTIALASETTRKITYPPKSHIDVIASFRLTASYSSYCKLL